MIKKTLSLITAILIYSCASVQSPTGGEKDTKNPVLYESNPKDQSINFDKQEITLYFNEWMKVEQIQKELIITPREDIKYETRLNKQEFVIELEEPLKDSVTYTFNFRQALKDITEGNLWLNPTIAFSTGPYLDSLSINGTVSNLKTTEPAPDYLVALYGADYDTANLRQGKPVYFTTTDENGNFKMQNIKAGKYKLYSFEDKNNNLINDSQSEPYGFHEQVINLFDSISPINLNTYQRNEDTLKLKKFSPTGKDFIIQYNKGLSFYTLTNPQDSNQIIYTNNIESSKNLKIYKENFPDLAYDTDSIALIVNTTDSIGMTRIDTAYFQTRESRITNDSIKIVRTPQGNILSGTQALDIELSKPVHEINYDSLQLRLDTIPIYTFTKADLSYNYNRKTLTLRPLIIQDSIQNIMDSITTAAKKANKDTTTNQNAQDSLSNQNNTSTNTPSPSSTANSESSTSNTVSANSTSNTLPLQLYIGKAAFLGIEKDSTKMTSIDLNFMKPSNYGIIKGTVIEPSFPFIVELLNEKYEVQDTLINQHSFQFNYVKPGKYRLRLLKDDNNNHSWDAGNPLTLTKAEQYFHFQEEITVKANWEVIDKNFDFTVDKDVDKQTNTDDL